MSIDTELRRLGASTRETVVSGLDVEARLGDLKAATRRRRNRRTVAGLAAAAAAVVTVAGLVRLGTVHDRSDVVGPDHGRKTVTCAEALSDAVSPGGAVQCLAPRLVLVRGRVDYTFRLPVGVEWRIVPSGAPATVVARVDPVEVQAGILILVDVRAAAGGDGRELSAGDLASWVAARPFLESTPPHATTQHGLPAWTVEVRPRPDLPRLRPSLACGSVNTDCHKLLVWRQGGATMEFGAWDGQVSRWTFVDVPGRGTVALVAWAKRSDEVLLDEGTVLLRTVDFVLPAD